MHTKYFFRLALASALLLAVFGAALARRPEPRVSRNNQQVRKWPANASNKRVTPEPRFRELVSNLVGGWNSYWNSKKSTTTQAPQTTRASTTEEYTTQEYNTGPPAAGDSPSSNDQRDNGTGQGHQPAEGQNNETHFVEETTEEYSNEPPAEDSWHYQTTQGSWNESSVENRNQSGSEDYWNQETTEGYWYDETAGNFPASAPADYWSDETAGNSPASAPADYWSDETAGNSPASPPPADYWSDETAGNSPASAPADYWNQETTEDNWNDRTTGNWFEESPQNPPFNPPPPPSQEPQQQGCSFTITIYPGGCGPQPVIQQNPQCTTPTQESVTYHG